MGKLLEETLRAIIKFFGDAVMFILGLLGVIVAVLVSLAGELIDDLTKYKDYGMDWSHVAHVMVPPLGLAIGAYIKHRKTVADAINSPAPAPEVKATVLQQKIEKEGQ